MCWLPKLIDVSKLTLPCNIFNRLFTGLGGSCLSDLLVGYSAFLVHFYITSSLKMIGPWFFLFHVSWTLCRQCPRGLTFPLTWTILFSLHFTCSESHLCLWDRKPFLPLNSLQIHPSNSTLDLSPDSTLVFNSYAFNAHSAIIFDQTQTSSAHHTCVAEYRSLLCNSGASQSEVLISQTVPYSQMHYDSKVYL